MARDKSHLCLCLPPPIKCGHWETKWVTNSPGSFGAWSNDPIRVLHPSSSCTGLKQWPHKELKYEALHTNSNFVQDPDEQASKDLLETYRVQALNNLNKYQITTKVWRDKKVTQRNLTRVTWSSSPQWEQKVKASSSQSENAPLSSVWRLHRMPTG